jgi:hypothetical protein
MQQSKTATFAGRGSVEVEDALKGLFYLFRVARTAD